MTGKYVLYDSAKHNPGTLSARVAAAAVGIKLDVCVTSAKETAKDTMWKLNVHPMGKLPALETPQGYLMGPNAIARYIAALGDGNLQGRTCQAQAEVDSWMCLAADDAAPAANGWLNSKDSGIRRQAVERMENVCKAVNMWLEIRTFLVDDRLTLADVAVCAALLPLISGGALDDTFRAPYRHLTRWLRTCFHQDPFVAVIGCVVELPKTAKKGMSAESITGVAPGAAPAAAAAAAPAAAAPAPAKAAAAPAAKPKGDKKAAEKPKKQPPAATPVDGAMFDIRVGKILEAKKHPDADSLYVEQIDVGEGEPRTICSGLVKYMEVSQVAGRECLVMCNLKPAKMRGIFSNGMVMCSEAGDSCDFVKPPAGCKPGDRVHLPKYEAAKPAGEPIKPLVKSKELPGLLAELQTDADGVVLWKDCPWTIEGKGQVTAAHKSAKVK